MVVCLQKNAVVLPAAALHEARAHNRNQRANAYQEVGNLSLDEKEIRTVHDVDRCHPIFVGLVPTQNQIRRPGLPVFLPAERPQREANALIQHRRKLASAAEGEAAIPKPAARIGCRRHCRARSRSGAWARPEQIVHRGDNFVHGDPAVAIAVACRADSNPLVAQGNVHHGHDFIHRDLAVAVAVAQTLASRFLREQPQQRQDRTQQHPMHKRSPCTVDVPLAATRLCGLAQQPGAGTMGEPRERSKPRPHQCMRVRKRRVCARLSSSSELF